LLRVELKGVLEGLSPSKKLSSPFPLIREGDKEDRAIKQY